MPVFYGDIGDIQSKKRLSFVRLSHRNWAS